jgi:hypothetical protein
MKWHSLTSISIILVVIIVVNHHFFYIRQNSTIFSLLLWKRIEENEF